MKSVEKVEIVEVDAVFGMEYGGTKKRATYSESEKPHQSELKSDDGWQKSAVQLGSFPGKESKIRHQTVVQSEINPDCPATSPEPTTASFPNHNRPNHSSLQVANHSLSTV